MNFRSLLMIAAFAALGAINVNAQINEDLSKVKILRTQDAGFRNRCMAAQLSVTIYDPNHTEKRCLFV